MEDNGRPTTPAPDDEPIRRSEPLEIGNEFAFVRVCKVWTRNGERLEIFPRARSG